MKTKHGQRVPPDLQNDNSKWVKLFVFDKIVEFSTRNITFRFGTFKIGDLSPLWLEVTIRDRLNLPLHDSNAVNLETIELGVKH